MEYPHVIPQVPLVREIFATNLADNLARLKTGPHVVLQFGRGTELVSTNSTIPNRTLELSKGPKLLHPPILPLTCYWSFNSLFNSPGVIDYILAD